MINYGFYRGKNLPDVRISLQLLDWILEGGSVVILIAIWTLIIKYYDNPAIVNKQLITFGIASVIATVIFLLLTHCSIRVINFPVKITDNNMYIQGMLAFRTTRIFAIEINLIFLSALLNGISSVWAINENIFNYILYANLLLIVITFAGYYFFAFRFKGW